MPRFTWNCCGLLVAAAVTFVGCAKPATTPPAEPAHTDAQHSSTTGGGTEVPATTDAPAVDTTVTPDAAAPAEATPAAPAEATPAAPAAPEKAPE